VVELLLATVRPVQFLAGKVIGIGLVGLGNRCGSPLATSRPGRPASRWRSC
jgi:hypothetical protein